MEVLNSPHLKSEILIERLERSALGRCHFALAIGATALSDIDGISAAGNTPQNRRLTAKLDSDVLYQSLQNREQKPGHELPTSPRGITSPVVLTSAALSLIEHSLVIYDCGVFEGCSPDAPHVKVSTQHADRAASGALPLPVVQALFDSGLRYGAGVPATDTICLAECVPGGTSTAALVLMLLGIQALNMVSSSLPDCGGNYKANLLQAELATLCKSTGKTLSQLQEICRKSPLMAVSMAGDPVQAFAAGYLLAACKNIAESANQSDRMAIAAGGAQMIAIYGLMRELCQSGYDSYKNHLEQNLAIITTSYVACDPYARVGDLARLCQAPLISFDPRLEDSEHAGLRAYTEGNVKEGVGAGAATALASMRCGKAKLISQIDADYTRLVKDQSPAAHAPAV